MIMQTLAVIGGFAFILLLGVLGYNARKNRRDDNTPTLFETVMDTIADNESVLRPDDDDSGDGKK